MPRAVLVAVQLPSVTDAEHASSLAELRRLVTTLGHEVVGTASQKRKALDGGVVLGEGKLVELAGWTGGTGVVEKKKRRPKKKDLPEDEDEDEAPPPAAEARADVVVVDHELTPMQFENLAAATGAQVLDRTGVIVEIFHRHAASAEARLQVELARLKYVAPRLRASAGGFDRQGGGIGAKGAGESQLELDRRRIRDRIAEIRAELVRIEGTRSTRRARRADEDRVALVGYTNAGKSSWMRALTGSRVLVEDKLFATLDTTVRALEPPTVPRVLVTDTVGFIQKLPHDLVASFRSTLDEALAATLLAYVVDAADPAWRRHLEVTREVLGEIGAGGIPAILLLNKCDRLDAAAREALAAERPDALLVSARDPADVARVRAAIVAHVVAGLAEADLVVPYDRSALVGEIRSRAHVLAESYEDDGIHYRLRASVPTVSWLRERLV